jgi:hypothetical protein
MSSRSSALQTHRTRGMGPDEQELIPNRLMRVKSYDPSAMKGISEGFASASIWSHSNGLANTKGLLLCRRSFVFMKLAMLAY